MDPVTRAAKALGEALRGRLRAAPGGDPQRPAATRIVLEHASPKDLVSALRLAEHHPKNRSPFVLFDGAFGDETGFLAGAGAIVARDEQALREGLGEDGLVVAEAAPSLPLADAAAFGAALGRWARALTPTLDGLVVGLVPSSVRHAEGYRRVVETVLAHAAGRPIHVLVRDFGDPALAGMCPEVVTHAVDPAEVARHLANLGSGAGAKGAPEREGAGPAAGPVTVDGKPVLSEAGGAALRRWLLEAGEASSRGAFTHAVKKLRAARMSCHLAGLTREEAIVEVSLGTAHFSAGEVERALAAYARGKGLALAAGVEVVAAQACFGVGAIHFAASRWAEAEVAYGEAEALAKDAEPLALEAARLRGECLLALGKREEARELLAAVWERAQAAPPAVRAAVAMEALREVVVRAG